MRAITTVMVAATLLALSACSRFPYVYLINNSGMSLEVLRAEGDGNDQTSERVDGWFFGRVWIANGDGRDVMWRWPESTARIEIKLGRCTLWYALPELTTSYNATAVVRLEPDRLLYLIDADVWGIREMTIKDPFNSFRLSRAASQSRGYKVFARTVTVAGRERESPEAGEIAARREWRETYGRNRLPRSAFSPRPQTRKALPHDKPPLD